MNNSGPSRNRLARPRPRTAAQLSEPLSHSLNAYALTAAAAGVTMLACAMPAEGSPVCTNLSADVLQTNSLPFILPGNAIPSFNIAQTTYSYYANTTGVGLLWWNRGFFTPNSAGAKVLLGADGLPASVASGAKIGPSGQFGKGASYGLLFTYGRGVNSFKGGGTFSKHRGNLRLAQVDYIGFQFSEFGSVHYGWVRLKVSIRPRFNSSYTTIRVFGYGYESEPNTAITAGSCGPQVQPSSSNSQSFPPDSQGPSLGMLALGSEGVQMWRGPR